MEAVVYELNLIRMILQAIGVLMAIGVLAYTTLTLISILKK